MTEISFLFYLKYLKYREPGQKALVWIGNKWAVSMRGKVFSMSACPFLTALLQHAKQWKISSNNAFKQTLHPWFQRRWVGKKKSRGKEWVILGDRASRPRYDLHLYHSLYFINYEFGLGLAWEVWKLDSGEAAKINTGPHSRNGLERLSKM